LSLAILQSQKFVQRYYFKYKKTFINTNQNQQTRFVDKIRIVSVFSSSSAVNDLTQRNAERSQYEIFYWLKSRFIAFSRVENVPQCGKRVRKW
jgi:hypothetical protein